MKKMFCLLLVFTLTIPVFAEIKVSGNAPTVSGIGADSFNEEIQEAFNMALQELDDQLKVFKSPNKFLQGMGDSSVYGSHGATTRGYGGYKLFSATVGPIIGIQLPKNIASVLKDLSSGENNIIQSLKDEGDIQAGISPNILNANIGINMGLIKVLPEKIGLLKRDHLYMGLRIGYFGLPEINFGNDFKVKYSNLTLGLTANYQLIPSIKLPFLFTWRGLNLGSGLIYNRSRMGFGMTVDDIEQPLDSGSSVVVETPRTLINLTSNTFVIPLEAVTAIKLLIFNIPVGIGADIAFGKTSLGAEVTADIDIEDLPYTYTRKDKGNVTAAGSISHSPSIFNFKFMTGLGISAGPVVFDVPITFYPASSGYTIGITIGAVY